MRPITALLMLLCAASANAYELQQLAVLREGNTYTLNLRATVQAPPAKVFARLVDFNTMTDINPLMTLVSVVPQGDGLRLISKVQACVLGFCRTLQNVQYVRVLPTSDGGELQLETDPGVVSDFRNGRSRWAVSAQGQGTLIEFSTHTEPTLWLPPIIGPIAVEQRLREQAEQSIANLEQLARD